LDTREKIVTLAEALDWAEKHRRAPLVRGYFDPLLAEHTQALSELVAGGAGVVVLVEDDEEDGAGPSLLPAQARAELVAGLRSVARVAVVPAAAADAAAATVVVVIDWREADAIRRQGLIEHVRSRHD
jgi:glycerol-3-phosphate cytidylyltransferase-like family protein